jgi:hypothetical protein
MFDGFGGSKRCHAAFLAAFLKAFQARIEAASETLSRHAYDHHEPSANFIFRPPVESGGRERKPAVRASGWQAA